MNGKALSKAFTAVSALYPDCQAVKLTLDHQRWFIRECQRQLTAADRPHRGDSSKAELSGVRA